MVHARAHDHHSVEVEVEVDSHDTGLEDTLDAAVVGGLAAHSEEEVAGSYTVAAHPDLPGLRADHAPRRALPAVAHSDLAGHPDRPQERAHWVHTAQMPGQKPLAMRQDGKDIAD